MNRFRVSQKLILTKVDCRGGSKVLHTVKEGTCEIKETNMLVLFISYKCSYIYIATSKLVHEGQGKERLINHPTPLPQFVLTPLHLSKKLDNQISLEFLYVVTGDQCSN